MGHPLETLYTLEGYSKKFTDPILWSPYIILVCQRHHLSPIHPIRTGIPGTFPTFIVGNLWVIKFFGPLFDGPISYEIEIWVNRLITRYIHSMPSRVAIRPAPLIGSGQLFNDSQTWPWSYLIFDYIPGRSFGEAFDQIDGTNRINIAFKLGLWTSWFHHLDITDPIVERPTVLEKYIDFIGKRIIGCSERHRNWQSLPASLIDQIDSFLPPIEQLAESNQPAHLIHADLTGDHLLGEAQNGIWLSHGLIDFGDAREGNLYYELGALHLHMFRGDKRLLKAFFEGYSQYQPPYFESVTPRQFARLSLATGLLHQFNIFENLPQIIPNINRITSLEQLSERLYLI